MLTSQERVEIAESAVFGERVVDIESIEANERAEASERTETSERVEVVESVEVYERAGRPNQAARLLIRPRAFQRTCAATSQ